MRPLQAVLFAASLAAAIGCSLIGKNTGDPKPTTSLARVKAEDLVSYLNERASRVQTLGSDVQMTARITSGLGLMSGNLRGDLMARQPRDFRMTGHGMAGDVDLGSNSENFWVYTKDPTHQPMFVYASYNDFEAGNAKLPGGIPFEPEWVMQALGMHSFPASIHYNAPIPNQSERTYTLSWQATTPGGMAIVKEIVFDADNAREGMPQVKKHVVRDTNRKVICSAEVKSVRTVPIASNDPHAPQLSVQYPTHILLNWPTQNFELDLNLVNAQVNVPLNEQQARGYFTRPNNMGVPALDLAKYEFKSH